MSATETDYKEKISELRQTLAWMDIVLSNVADAVCVIKEDGKIMFINDSFAETINRSRIELLGMNMQDVIKLTPKASSYPEAFPFKESDNMGSDSTKGIYEWHLDGNDILTVKLMAHHVQPSNQIVIMLQNITNEYEVEQISRNFANLASHQLKTPLSSIKTLAHMLAEGYMGELQQKQLTAAKSVIDATDHMNELLNMLLDISKLENKKYEKRHEEVYIKDVLDRIYSEVNEKVSEKEIEMNMNLPRKMAPFLSDSHMLHEVFSNIISNAIKYTPSKGKVSISVAADDENCVVVVEDNGIGIPKQHQDEIFSQFYRAENAIHSNQAGTGLGLYLVKQLISLLGGEISFKSAYQKGTTFWITLPTRS